MPIRNVVNKLAIRLGGDDVSRMLVRQNLTGHPVHERKIPGGAIGCLGGDSLPQEGNFLLFTGVPINGPDPKDFTDADTAIRLFALFDGAFAGVFWDAANEILVVATDRLGMQPLYMSHAEDDIKLVSETKALTGEPDLSAWGAFISIGHPVGDRSLMQGLERVPPASMLVYGCKHQTLKRQAYWAWPEPTDAWRHYDFIGALEEDVRAYHALGENGTLLLSGGFDSRLLLFLLKRARVPVDATIVAHEDELGDADGRLAERIASIAYIRYEKKYPAPGFFSSRAYVDYLKASDVGFPSLDLFIAKVAAQIDAQAIWEGLVPGFLFMPLHQPEGGFNAYFDQEIRGRDSPIWNAARSIFRPEAAEAMFEGFTQDLGAALADIPRDAHGLARFVIQNRSRNRASMNPLKVYANYTTVFTPGLSRDFLTHALSIPFSEKRYARFYMDLFSRLDNRALRMPFVSGGELIRTTSMQPAYYLEYIRASLLKYQMRHPRLFAPWAGARKQRRSIFLDKRLSETDNRWLKPNLGELLHSGKGVSHLTWKLLFHWKAWQWLHEGRLDEMLGGAES